MVAPLRMSAIACAAAVTALGIWAGELANPDGLIERSLDDAFSRQPPVAREAAPATATRLDPSLLHLSRLPAAPSAPSLALGDRITLTAHSGAAVAYEIVEVRALPSSAATDTGRDFVVITAVTTDHSPQETIRFIVEAGGQSGDSSPAAKPRAL